jgi:ATP-dependent RNA helicase RhlE
MLDMGFINDIRKIIAKLPPKRQNLMFSATMPPAIRDLAHTILHQPVRVEVAPVASAAETVDQSVYFVAKQNKPFLLQHLLSTIHVDRALVFTRTKHGADRVVRQLHRAGIKALAIHGDKSQGQRQRALNDFKSSKIHVLIATDIAARGIDVDNLTHVFNYDLPNEPESYVHRIGRTGRAGRNGVAIAFCDHEERSYLQAIERLTRRKITVLEDHPEYPKLEPRPQHHAPATAGSSHQGHGGRGQGGYRGGNSSGGGGPMHSGGNRNTRSGQRSRGHSGGHSGHGGHGGGHSGRTSGGSGGGRRGGQH